MSQIGFQFIELKLPTDYKDSLIQTEIEKNLKIKNFSYQIEKKSLDARKKNNIHWLLRVGVSSPEIKINQKPKEETLDIPYNKKNQKVVVIGSGPAGFFSAYILSKSGFQVTLLEQGKPTEERVKDILHFEATGHLQDDSNYSFGEGGAGTFSDGKLTSRTKTISKERQFILDTFIQAGAPEEISYLSSPHIGSDYLQQMMPRLRKIFTNLNGLINFSEKVISLKIKNNRVICVNTQKNEYPADFFIFAPGHSSFETYRMLLNNHVPFRVKPFAVGSRVEHLQQEINRAQWNTPYLKGIKAAEYKLTCSPKDQFPSYSFCMCPGGKVVPASPKKGLSIVNGVSNYQRNSKFANSAIVTAFHLNDLLQHQVSPQEALDWVEKLERSVFEIKNSYEIPANVIEDFLLGKTCQKLPESSYPFSLFSYDFRPIFPKAVLESLKTGLKDFCKKVRGFEKGILLGIETKTSSPIQAFRDAKGKCEGFENLYCVGEGSGWAGGIISSAADGIKTALNLIH